MANPVFNASNVFGEPRRGRAGTVTSAPQDWQSGRYAQAGAGGAAATDAAALERMYGAPSATTRDTQR
ncbi:MAG TPA: hypothetical protein PKB06_05655, partial [Actinotalea sp.]|nr:hypothetical protein [Actinotalea sp.]